MFVLGITGLIGSGKSEVCKLLSNYGFQVMELDKIAHQSYQVGTDVYKEIINIFGFQIINSDLTINREKLGDIVFSDKKKLIDLQELVWPKVDNEIRSRIKTLKKALCEKVTIESALLFKGGWDKFCDQIWFVESSENIIKLRLANFRGMTEDKIDSILSLQLGSPEIKEKADQIIFNDDDLQNLEKIINKTLKIV
jgi:dephospho-CoA kinase